MTLQKSQVTETGERISISIEIKIKKNNEFPLWARYWEHRDEYDIGPAHFITKPKFRGGQLVCFMLISF